MHQPAAKEMHQAQYFHRTQKPDSLDVQRVQYLHLATVATTAPSYQNLPTGATRANLEHRTHPSHFSPLPPSPAQKCQCNGSFLCKTRWQKKRNERLNESNSDKWWHSRGLIRPYTTRSGAGANHTEAILHLSRGHFNRCATHSGWEVVDNGK